MMMRNIWSILCLLSAVAAFQPITMRPGMATTTARYMFNADDKKPAATKPLEEVSPLEEVNAADSVVASTDESTTTEEKPKNYYKNMNTGEIKEVEWNDPYMEANTSIADLGWASAFIIFPMILLANDFLHFLPPGTPFTKY